MGLIGSMTSIIAPNRTQAGELSLGHDGLLISLVKVLNQLGHLAQAVDLQQMNRDG